jgi:hypothetical protein
MSWLRRKKPNDNLNSDEFEQLNKKIVSIISDIDLINNRLALVDSIVKSNRARISKIKVDEIMKEGEKDIKDGPVYI